MKKKIVILKNENLEVSKGLLNEIEKRAKETIIKFRESELFLLDFYSLIILNSTKKNLKEMVSLLDEVEVRVKKNEFKERDKSMVYFYSNIIARNAEDMKPEDLKEWFNEVEKRTKYALKDFKNREIFLVNFYVFIIINANINDLTKWMTWRGEVEKRVNRAAKEFRNPKSFIKTFKSKVAFHYSTLVLEHKAI